MVCPHSLHTCRTDQVEISLSYTHGQKWLEEAFQALSDICKKQDIGMVPTIWHGANDTTITKGSHCQYSFNTYMGKRLKVISMVTGDDRVDAEDGM